MPIENQRHPASYRDPSGFIFKHEGKVYRQVNQVFKEDFDKFISSGLYDELVKDQLLIPHQVIDENLTGDQDWYTTLQPQFIRFISYPYEWCFDMLKDAALLILRLANIAMQYGMILKDASPYNIQWHNGKLIFIDTLSFEKYDETKPWIAYRQYCENFVAPLALMSYLQIPLQSLLLSYPEGLPLTLAKKMLPWKSRLNMHLYLNLHLHASYSNKKSSVKSTIPFSRQKLSNILKSLEALINPFELRYKGIWADYYKEAEQRTDYIAAKKKIIETWINNLDKINTAIDAGANDGTFSALLQQKGIFTISADLDHYAINHLYKKAKTNGIDLTNPILIDFANPSPATGLNNKERSSFIDRTHTDLVLALAFIHHLAIGKNIPFEDIAQLFLHLGKKLIVEFVGKQDEKIQFMLQLKKDIYSWYSEENFKNVFEKYYKIISAQPISYHRTLYLMIPHES